jgi:hypothetical protein
MIRSDGCTLPALSDSRMGVSRAGDRVLAIANFRLRRPVVKFVLARRQNEHARRVPSPEDILRRLVEGSLSADISDRYRDHFFSRSEPSQNFAHAIFAQRAHAELARTLPQEQR